MVILVRLKILEYHSLEKIDNPQYLIKIFVNIKKALIDNCEYRKE
jgi:hypothetical protein